MAGTDPKIATGPTSFTEKYVRAKSRKPIVRFPVISNKPHALQVWCNPVFRGSYWVRGSGTAHKKCKKRHMRNKPTAESSHGIRQALTVPAVIAAVFLGLHVPAALLAAQSHVGRRLPFLYAHPDPGPVRGAGRTAICSRLPATMPRVGAEYPVAALGGAVNASWITWTLGLILAIAVFVLFSSARHFLGDGLSSPGKTGSGRLARQIPGTAHLRFCRSPAPRG